MHCERLCVYLHRAHCHTLPCALPNTAAQGRVHYRTQTRQTLPHTAEQPQTAARAAILNYQAHCRSLPHALRAHYRAHCHTLPLTLPYTATLPHTAAYCRTAGQLHTAAHTAIYTLPSTLPHTIARRTARTARTLLCALMPQTACCLHCCNLPNCCTLPHCPTAAAQSIYNILFT
jgi:hypothetical protein